MSDQRDDAIEGSAPSVEQGAGDPSVGEGGDSSVLEQLYAELGRAHAVGEDLDEQDQAALKELDTAEQRLIGEREQAEQAGDDEHLQEIDDDLDKLREAYRTITDRQPDDSDADDSGDDAA